jgi:hypothetical protein
MSGGSVGGAKTGIAIPDQPDAAVELVIDLCPASLSGGTGAAAVLQMLNRAERAPDSITVYSADSDLADRTSALGRTSRIACHPDLALPRRAADAR